MEKNSSHPVKTFSAQFIHYYTYDQVIMKIYIHVLSSHRSNSIPISGTNNNASYVSSFTIKIPRNQWYNLILFNRKTTEKYKNTFSKI